MAKQKVRPVRIEGDVAYVPLTRGAEAIIDAADAAFVGQWNWGAAVSATGHIYAVRTVCIGDKHKTLRLHRELIRPDEELVVDHIDQNPLNNRRSNLRVCTRSENSMNRGTPRHNKLGVKGVSWNPSRRMFAAEVRVKGCNVHRTFHATLDEAREAYQKAAKAHHGQFYPGVLVDSLTSTD